MTDLGNKIETIYGTNLMNKLSSIYLLIFSVALNAEVLSSADNGFSIKIEAEVNASQEQTYKQFLKVGEWWNQDHTWFGNSKGLSIKAKVGGCFCEKNGNQQALHMTVSYVNPNHEIRMIGGLGPLQTMGLHGGMTWKFEKIDTNKTRIIHTYNVSGYSKDGLKSLAPIVDKVQTIQVNGLVSKLNKK